MYVHNENESKFKNRLNYYLEILNKLMSVFFCVRSERKDVANSSQQTETDSVGSLSQNTVIVVSNTDGIMVEQSKSTTPIHANDTGEELSVVENAESKNGNEHRSPIDMDQSANTKDIDQEVESTLPEAEIHIGNNSETSADIDMESASEKVR